MKTPFLVSRFGLMVAVTLGIVYLICTLYHKPLRPFAYWLIIVIVIQVTFHLIKIVRMNRAFKRRINAMCKNVE